MKNFTLINKRLLLTIAFLSTLSFSFGQTVLSAGDIAITGYNSDYEDDFAFVLLRDITATTEINFTDNGWQSSGSFRTTEGVLTWSTDIDLDCGTKVIVYKSLNSNPFRATIGNISSSGSFILATGGDQITAFQGLISSPTNIFSVNFNSLTWTDATNSNNTALPSGLTDAVNAVSLGNRDNGIYNCSVSNDAANILSSVSASANWTTSNVADYTLGTCEYFCSSDSADWCNLQWPDVGNIPLGNVFDVYARVYEPGVTDNAGQGAGIVAWIGYSTTNTDPSTWTDWVLATYNVDDGNNDEYTADIGSVIPASGTYYFASRFQYNDGPYTYGGYSPAPGGGFWDGSTYVSNILTVNTSCTSTVTWNGSWTPATGPDSTTEVIIAANYDSTSLPSFNACSLTVNAGALLTIDNSKYIEVNNDIVINGDLLIRSRGSLIQNNNNATVTGTTTVEKTTANINNWYEYTYWSSPVSDETIADGLSESDFDRRYWFNAANYIDALAETNNNNTYVSGQDDIDDDNNDWQYASGLMIPGRGYAATHNEIGFIGPGQYLYTFTGILNNGVISVPVERNDTETNDINWNFIGNPYPSAIDVDLFFAENNYDPITNPDGTLDGAIYLWSQNTAPTDTNNGNEQQNFANSDYAIINGTGVVTAGDGLTPNRYIPSGQGFFTAFSNSRTVSTGNVEFNNSMRVTGNNDQFFRINNGSQNNKLFIDLTSDNGVFNQLLVGYLNGATDSNDGMFFDAPRNLSTGSAAIIYSIIEGNSRKFAIQGKKATSLTTEEVIPLGFKNTIETDTQFTISIANLEGEFLNSNAIYLRDNLLNIDHDLKASDYTFASDVGEFNDRFEIHFSNALSIDEFISNNDQLIIRNGNQQLTFSTTQQSIINNVKLYDMLGRKLYDLDFNSGTLEATIKLNGLNNSLFITKVTLDNGTVFTKKGILK